MNLSVWYSIERRECLSWYHIYYSISKLELPLQSTNINYDIWKRFFSVGLTKHCVIYWKYRAFLLFLFKYILHMYGFNICMVSIQFSSRGVWTMTISLLHSAPSRVTSVLLSSSIAIAADGGGGGSRDHCCCEQLSVTVSLAVSVNRLFLCLALAHGLCICIFSLH